MLNKKVFLLTIFLVSGFLFFLSYKNPLTLKSISERHKRGDLALSLEESEAIRRQLSLRVKKQGFPKTYSYLRENFIQQGSAVNHAIQHYFGKMVYENFGLEGIKFCGYSYPNGCTHGLILKAIEKEGYETAIASIINACKEAGDAKISCTHILGHEFENRYLNEGVNRALSECINLNFGTPFSVCGSGVFMQYYFPNVYEGGSKDQMRKFEEGNAYKLCIPLKGLFRRACTLYTVEWWQFGVNKDYKKVFYLCGKLELDTDRNDCYRSIGVVAADNFSSNSQKINEVCMLGGNKNKRLMCLSGAVKFLNYNDKLEIESAAKYICGLESEKCRSMSEEVYY